MLPIRTLWAVKILLVLHRASAAGRSPVGSRELSAACVGPHTDTYIYRRTLRELVAKTDYVTCVFQSGRTLYEWNPDYNPTLYDLVVRLDGGMHETSHIFWSYDNTRTMQPLQKVCRVFDRMIQSYLSEIHIEELESPALSPQGGLIPSQPVRLPTGTPAPDMAERSDRRLEKEHMHRKITNHYKINRT